MKFKNSPATFRGKPSRKHLHALHGAAAAEFISALPTKAQATLERVQGQVLRVHPSIGVLHMKLPSKISTAQAIESLYRSGAVEYAEPNVVIIPQGLPNDPMFPNQWSLHNTLSGTQGTPGADIKAPEAWDIVYPGNAVSGFGSTIVAVIDTGVDFYHQDFYLDPSVVLPLPAPPNFNFPATNLWINTLFPPDFARQGFNDGKDDDNDGFINDYFGIDATVTPNVGYTTPDTNGHGTAMAGIIGAVGNNGTGIAGVNWQTQVMSLKCMAGTTGDVVAAITCINYALAQLALAQELLPATPHHLVLTLGWSQASNTYSSSLQAALRVAQTSGALVVAAAGNSDVDTDIFPNYPSCYNHQVTDYPVVSPDSVILDNMISVGASDEFDKRQINSSYGMATVDLYAPGNHISTTGMGVTSGTTPPVHKNYATVSGTSFAAAHVAGACALLWNKYPDKDWTQIKAMILNGVDDGLAQDFRNTCVTEGRLNMLNSLQVPDNTPAVFSIFDITPAPGDPVIVPGRADTGQTIVITGVNFGTSGTLSFLGMTFPTANIVSWNTTKNPNQIVATVPAELPKGTGRLLVTNDAGKTSRGACFSNISRDKQVPVVVGSLILGRALAASGQVGNNVWLIGGRSYWGIVPHVEKYSLDTNHTVIDSDWMMPTTVSNAGAASIGSKIYVVGGATEDSAGAVTLVDNLQIFDTATLTWQQGQPLPMPLMQCAVTSLNGRLYAFGGLQATGATTYAAVINSYVYDPATNIWTSLANLPTATAYAAAAPTASGKIWVMGGFSSSSTTSQQRLVQEYNLSTNLWNIPSQPPHLFRPRGGAAGINYGGMVYCLYGTQPNGSVYDEYADGEWYNTAWGYWMPSILNYLGIYVAPPSVLARIGLYTPSPAKYQDKIFLLGGASGTESTYKYSYSNKVWAFTAPGGVVASPGNIPAVLDLLLQED